MHFHPIKILILWTFFDVFPAKASPLDTFFQRLGAVSNTSTPGAYQDQAAGYYTGGGYALRNRSSTVNPISVHLPTIKAGCNNLDMYMGSFSFMKGEQLVSMMRQIGSGIPTYAFQLGLKTMAPQLENLMSQLRKYVQDMNNTMLNSCQMSQQIVGGLWPKGTAASEQICMDQKGGHGEDWFGARDHCKNDRVAPQLQAAKNKYADLMVGEFNLVWHVIQKIPAYKNNPELAHFVLSVTGTLLSIKEGNQFRLKVIEPRADQKDFLSAFLKGGMTTMLRCDEPGKCLHPAPASIQVQDFPEAPHTTMKAKISHRIEDLRQKYLTKAAITEDDIGFLNDCVNVPVYRYIQVSAAAGTPFMMQDAAEYIGVMVLLTQFDRIMGEVLEAIDALQKVQLDDAAIEQFKVNLQNARGRLQGLLVGAQNGSIFSLTQSIKAIEQMIITKNN